MQFEIACCYVPDDFWERQRSSIAAGTFWADEAKKAGDEPEGRLRIALANLPLPGAFREAAVAVRNLIRQKRKAKASDEDELQLLYSLAAVESFVSASAYIEELAEPAWNAIEMMTREDWQSLKYDWRTLGSNELPLLTKTDRQQMLERWGEPTEHTTLRQLHRDIWNRALNVLLERRVREHNTSWLAPKQPITASGYLEFIRDVQQRVKAQRAQT